MPVGITAGVDAMIAEQFSTERHVAERAVAGPPVGGRGIQVAHNPRAAQEALGPRVDSSFALDHLGSWQRNAVQGGNRPGWLLLGNGGTRWLPATAERQRGYAGSALFVRAEVSEYLVSGFRMLRQDELKMVPQGAFNRGDILIRHPAFIRPRAHPARP